MKKKICVPCEAQGRNNIKATREVEFNGEIVPCCDYCYDQIVNDLFFFNLEDEESEEQECD